MEIIYNLFCCNAQKNDAAKDLPLYKKGIVMSQSTNTTLPFAFPEQLSNATKATIDAQLSIFSTFTAQAIDGLEKIAELNLTVAKTSLEELNATVKQLLSTKDAQSFVSLATSHAQPNADKALAYVRHLASITSETQTELNKATEAHVTEATRKAVAFVDDMTKNAPVGSEQVIGLFKSALGSASAGYEQFNRAAKQTAEVIESNLNNISQTAARATNRASSKRG